MNPCVFICVDNGVDDVDGVDGVDNGVDDVDGVDGNKV
jgi:hypothetical protein